MSNLIILLLEVIEIGSIVTCICVYAWRKEIKAFLYAWIAVATILANVQLVGGFEVANISISGGNPWFASSFVVVAFISSFFGERDAYMGVLVGGFSIFVFILFSLLSSRFSWVYGEALKDVCSTSLRVGASSLLMYMLGLFLDAKLVAKLKRKKDVSSFKITLISIICNCIENIGLFFLGFLGVLDINTIIELITTSSIIETIIGVFNEPFVELIIRLSSRRK